MLFGSSDTLELLHCILNRHEGNTGEWAAGFGSQVRSLRYGVEFPHYGLLSWADGKAASGDAHALFIRRKRQARLTDSTPPLSGVSLSIVTDSPILGCPL